MLHTGDQVMHKGYGLGTVRDVYTNPETGKLTAVVHFDNPPGMVVKNGRKGLYPVLLMPAEQEQQS